jgi:UDP-N-acetylglucosamine 1-carboxyvinyltransferase
MMAAQVVARGKSCIEETVFENRFMHIKELQKMGAQIEVHGSKAIVNGVEELYGTNVLASDIRASCALVLAALVADSQSTILGLHHWRRGYDGLEKKLKTLGVNIQITN